MLRIFYRDGGSRLSHTKCDTSMGTDFGRIYFKLMLLYNCTVYTTDLDTRFRGTFRLFSTLFLYFYKDEVHLSPSSNYLCMFTPANGNEFLSDITYCLENNWLLFEYESYVYTLGELKVNMYIT